MNKFNRDYAVVLPTGKIVLETHNLLRAAECRDELALDGIKATVVQSDLPRR